MSNPTSDPTALRCPSCGAALPNGGTRIECEFCGTVIDLSRRRSAATPAQRPSQPAGTGSRAPQVTVQRRQANQQPVNITGCILLILLPFLAIAGIVAYFVIGNVPGTVTRTSGPSIPSIPEIVAVQPNLDPTDRMVLLQPDDAPAGTLPQILVLVYDRSNESKYRLAMLSQSDRKIIWTGPTLSEQALSYAQFAFTSDTVFFVDERSLIAYKRSDGTQLWDAQLSDRLCEECLVVAGESIMALGIDDQLAAFDPASGELLWSKDLESSHGRRLDVYKGELMIYANDEAGDGQIQFLSPENGRVSRSITPTCIGRTFPDSPIEFSPYNPVWVDTEAGRAVLITDSSDTCIHAYDLTSGDQLWQTVPEDRSWSITSDTQFLPVGNELVISSRDALIAVNLESGALRDIIIDDDYLYRPILERDGVLASIAVRQRGTTRAELWGIDMQSGKRLWRREFKGEGQMIGPPLDAGGTLDEGDEIWTWAPAERGIAIITLSAQPFEYAIETRDVASGEVLDTKNIAQQTGSSSTIWAPDLAARDGGTLYLTSSTDSSIVALDANQGAVAYEGP